MEKVNQKFSINALIRYVLLIAVGLILIYPLFWMIGSSFKENMDIFGTFSIFPPSGRAVTNNFADAWNISSDYTIWFYFGNTLKFLIPKTAFTIISCSLTAYVVARKKE